jgi:DNA-binding NarL/FixJ family response regulator
MNTDPTLAAEAFRRRASGYLLKTCAALELTIAIREVLNGRSYLSPAIANETVDFLLHREKESIPEERQQRREVLQLLTEEKTMKEAAYVLNLSVHTVAFHKLRIMEVLNAQNNTELVQYAIRHHLIAA